MMQADLITIKELLRDPQFKKYFTTVPVLPDHYTEENRPWKLMILKPGENAWRSKRFGTYQEAFAGFKKLYPTILNAAINCPPLDFMPPVRTVRVKNKIDPKTKRPILKTLVWRPQITADMGEHNWCAHCRRPSIFKVAVFKSARTGDFVQPDPEPLMRCIICGASERIVNLRYPEKHQQWDATRPKVYI